MPSLETLLGFFAASLVLAISPGPDNLFVLTLSTVHGRKAGLIVTLGLCTGLMVHTLAVTFGVAAIFQASDLAFMALKYCGAAYLLYLAWLAFRAKDVDGGNQDAPAAGKLYRRGIIMNITNPKVSIFFLALLPQFTDPSKGSIAAQMVVLGGIFILSTLIVFGAVALAAGSISAWMLKSKRARVWLNRLSGLVFIALAIRLATISR